VTPDDVSIGEFLDRVASERAAPAGGTAAAITAATGAALSEMVCVHTIAAADGRTSAAPAHGGNDAPPAEDRDGPDPDGLIALREGLRRRRRKLVALGERDAALVDDLFGTDEDPSTRLQRRAAGIPLAVAEASVGVLADAETASRRGRSGVAADAKTGAYLADAAIRASLETVRINAAALQDQSFAATLETRAADIEETAADARMRLFDGDR
jgi:formiminotetrahydrofolate cyclodeaminase